MFHDYAANPSVSEHSLQTDIRYTLSPNSLTMYEGDGELLSASFGSMCSDTSIFDTGQSEEFDLKPQFECSETSLMNLNIDLTSYEEMRADVGRRDPVWSPVETGVLKMEDIFQLDQKDAVYSPTLAELNFDDSLSVFDDIETILQKDDRAQPATVKCPAPWLVGRGKLEPSNTPPKITFAGNTTAAKFTTCTITSPTMTAPLDLTTTCQDSATHQVAPIMYAVTGKFSLFQETNTGPPLTAIKTEPQASPPICLPKLPAVVPTPVNPPLPKEVVPIEIVPIPLNEKKSSLQQLLTETTLPVIKTEPETADIPTPPVGATWGSKGVKRGLIPEGDVNTSGKSMEEKWEEIKQFIHDHSNEELDSDQKSVELEEPVRRKRVKSESQGKTFNVTLTKGLIRNL